MPPMSEDAQATRPQPITPALRAAEAGIALGSNLGDRAEHLRAALAAVATLPGVESVTPSGFYETAPAPGSPQDQGDFLNAAAVLTTTLSPEELLAELLRLEGKLGRPPREERQHWGPREIDLDLLFHGEAVRDTRGLTLPHPRMHQRDFVLDPLAEVVPEWIHPLRQQSVAAMRAALETAVAG
jgi:2-amino-4-hydroxy-6-hydroxymethyldihydropteridine diphosphokinase